MEEHQLHFTRPLLVNSSSVLQNQLTVIRMSIHKLTQRSSSLIYSQLNELSL